ncbi:MAG: hypothetical protein ACREOU_00250 [Candidatus Eiseniibacteriota bacterium]
MLQTRTRPLAAALIVILTSTFGGTLGGTLGCARAATPADRDARLGQWFLDPSSKRDRSDMLRISFRRTGVQGWQSWGSQLVSFDHLEGLTAADLTSGAHPVTFRVRRDGGTFHCRGSIDGNRGAGTYELVLDPKFPAELKRRGLETPTEAEHVRLVMANAGIALLDELHTQGYGRPDLLMLLKMADHGVSQDYVRSMGTLGYRLDSLNELVMARDHGVDPAYVRALANAGFKNLPFEQLLRARDHGVDAQFIEGYKELGYGDLSLDELISMRDHGVDPQFIEGMRDLGYKKASLEMFLMARNHGVDPEYVEDMADVGFKSLPLEELIQARNHGVDASYVRRVRASQGRDLALDEIIALRNQGYKPR